MSLSAYLTVIVANLLGALSPGPDIILILRTATRSRRHAVAAAFGIQVGVLMWVSLTVLGAAALLTAFPEILDAVQIVGGGWLIWMGQGLVRSGWENRTSPPVGLAEAAAALGTVRHTFVQGLTTNLSNPKIVLFLAALVAPLLPAHPSVGTSVALILGLAWSSLALFSVLSFVVSTRAVRRKMLVATPFIDLSAGLFFLAAGAVLVVRGVTALV